MDNSYKILLGSKKNKTSIDTDTFVDVSLSNIKKEIDEFDRNSSVNLAQVFDDERQASNIFRLTANIDVLFYNAYTGTTGLSGYTPFRDNLYFTNLDDAFGSGIWYGYPQYSEFDFIRKDNNISGYTINSGSTDAHVQFINKKATTYNWTYYVSYVYENNFNKVLEYNINSGNTHTWVCSDGIPFNIINVINQFGRGIISFECPVEHGLSEGEYVELDFINGWNGYNGNKVFQVSSLGNEGYNSEKYIFNIENIGYTGNTFYNNYQGIFKRIMDINNSGETKSKYYVRKHKIITNIEESILTNSGFQQNAFGVKRQFEVDCLTPDKKSKIAEKEGGQSYLLTFSKDIDITKLRDNWNRPVSELFITIINKGYFGWFNKPTYKDFALKEGFKFNLTNFVSPYWSNSNYAINLTNIGTSSYIKDYQYIFYYNEDLKSGDTLNGDFCEFNEFEGKERVISNLYHKFTFNDSIFKTNNGIVVNPNGYYYAPHYPYTLKVYSDYLEEGSIEEVTDIPDYAFYSNYKSKFIWRDLYTYGFIDENNLGVDYPFLNGTHYPYRKIIFRIMPEEFIKPNIISIAQPIIDDCE